MLLYQKTNTPICLEMYFSIRRFPTLLIFNFCLKWCQELTIKQSALNGKLFIKLTKNQKYNKKNNISHPNSCHNKCLSPHNRKEVMELLSLSEVIFNSLMNNIAYLRWVKESTLERRKMIKNVSLDIARIVCYKGMD